MQMIEHSKSGVSMRRKCELMDINRSRLYRKKKPDSKLDYKIMKEMIEIHKEMPFYGSRRMKVELENRGYKVNRKRVKRLMEKANLRAIYPKKRTTISNKQHKKYPYLLRDMAIKKPNQVWGIDITYIKIKTGYVYLVGIIDIFSRKIVGWSLSPYLDVRPSKEALEKALKNGIPEIINSDQGCQYTSNEWIITVESEGVKISMDGKGRWADNVFIERFWRSAKYECVYLHSFETIPEARKILGEYIKFYNQRRPHQSLGYKTPNFVYESCNCDDSIKGEAVDNFDYKSKLLYIPTKGGSKDSKVQINFWS